MTSSDQFAQVEKIGGLGGIMGMMPGMAKMKDQLAGRLDDKMITRQRAIISSMTPKERRNPGSDEGHRARSASRPVRA